MNASNRRLYNLHVEYSKSAPTIFCCGDFQSLEPGDILDNDTMMRSRSWIIKLYVRCKYCHKVITVDSVMSPSLNRIL